jgi:single-strand DNA-binding protein
MNKIILIGRAGKDPEVRYFDSGDAVAKFSLAVNKYKKDAEPDWFNIEVWGKQAQVAADYVRKGSQVAIEGSITLNKWTSNTTGEAMSSMVVRCDRLELIGSKRDAEQAAPLRRREQEDDDFDVPF